MQKTAIFLCVCSVLLLSGCNQSPAGGKNSGNAATLEKQVAEIQEQNRDLRAKMSAFQAFGTRSPLGDFFASPEFWQCTYDSSWSDCSSRCAKAATTHRASCAEMTDETKRLTCYQEASDNAANCVKNCPVQMSPINPSSCGGGGIL